MRKNEIGKNKAVFLKKPFLNLFLKETKDISLSSREKATTPLLCAAVPELALEHGAVRERERAAPVRSAAILESRISLSLSLSVSLSLSLHRLRDGERERESLIFFVFTHFWQFMKSSFRVSFDLLRPFDYCAPKTLPCLRSELVCKELAFKV